MEMEREEGELTDEDSGDLSDSSMSIVSLMIRNKDPIISMNKKSLRELSFMSISDDLSEDNETILITNKNKKRKHKVHHKRQERTESKCLKSKRLRPLPRRPYQDYKTESWRNQCSSLSSSSDSEEYVPDRKILKQLRDAVRINSSNTYPNCSLSTRIKRMIEPERKEDLDNDMELINLRDRALQTQVKNDAVESVDSNMSPVSDDDLIELRLVALQSAVLKKHQNRRSKKEQAQNKREIQSENVSIENKNNEVVDNTKTDELTQPKTENQTPTDVHKESDPKENVDNDIKLNIDEDEDILRAMLLTSISKKIAEKKAKLVENVPEIKKIPVAPFKATNPRAAMKKTFAPMPVNRFIINVNSDSDSDYDQPAENKKNTNNEKSNELFSRSLSLFLQQAREKSELDDVSKHLPHSQQLEYRKLKKKLHQLSNAYALDNKKLKSPLNINLKKHMPKLKTVNTVQNPNINNKKVINNSERLQINGKYEELAPLMTKVSEARVVRDKAQVEVKRLINELRIARIKLTSTHQNYTVLVQRLMKAKAVVDKRATQKTNQKSNVLTNKISKVPGMCTSTPNKSVKNEVSIEISGIDEVNKTIQCEPKEIHLPINEPTVKEKVQEEIQVFDDVPTKEINEERCIEGNDINIIIDKCDVIEKYTSPLDHIKSKGENHAGNPLSILCPYDLLGVCRDPDCTYRHCTKAVTD